MKKMAIIGGLGYVGMHLNKALEGLPWSVTVFARKNLKILTDERENLTITDITSLGNDIEKFDVVINLAWPDSYSRKKNFIANREIVDAIKKLSGPETYIIHTSTLVVFGTALDRKIMRQKISQKRDVMYSEVKVNIENLLLKTFKNYNLHIIRPGNIWGPGSPTWLMQVANRIIYQIPIPDTAKSAPSNVTYVHNLCDFIIHLSEQQSVNSQKKPHFHHFAEFGSIKWGQFLEKYGHILDQDPVYTQFQLSYPENLGQELSSILNPVMPKQVFYRMLSLRVLSSYAKSLIDLVPARYRMAIKSYSDGSIVSTDVMDFVLANQVLFQHVIDSDWNPKYDFDTAIEDVKKSMGVAGYLTSALTNFP